MATAKVAAKESPFANYYRWEEPHRDISVRLNLDTANSLQTEVLGAADSLRDSDLEIGGILLGRTEREQGKTLTVIEGFHPIPCEHLDGPFYCLSATDLVQLRSALARHKSGASRGHSVVGYYRSHNRQDLFLSGDDLSVIGTCFPDPDNIFLLIKALPGRTCTAGIFFWDNGQIQSEFTDSEVALIPIWQTPESGPATDEAYGDPAGFEELQAILSPEHDQAGATVRRRWVIGGFALGVAAVAAILAVIGHQEKGQAPPLNNQRPSVAANSTAPLPDPVGEPPAIDHTRQESRAAISVPPRIPVSRTAHVQSGTREPKETDRALVVKQDKTTDSSNASRAEAPEEHPPAPITSLPGPPPAPAPATAPPESTSAKPLGTTANPPVIAETPPVGQSAPPPALDQQRPVSAAPIPQTGTINQTVETRFVGPQIIHQVAPAIPLGVGPKITTPVQIDVTVTIDESGKVIGARVTSSSGAAAVLLTLEALKAANLFRFRPAQENNRRVRSDMVLTFRFAPKAG
jgi:TonB family protein